MSKGYRIFDDKNKKAMSEWDKINNAIMNTDGKKQMKTEDVERIEEVAPAHGPNRYSDEATAAATPRQLLHEGGRHWQPLGEYKVIDKGIHKFTIDEGGDRNSIYWPYIPNDKELMEEILEHRPGAKKMIGEHKKTMGWEISETAEKQYHRKEGF